MSKLMLWLFKLSRSFLLLFLCVVAGRILSNSINGFLPSSIIGMLILTLCLALGVIKTHWIELGANLLLRWLSLLFIPISVGLIEHLAFIAQNAFSILISLVISTLFVMGFSGRFWQWLEKSQ